MIHALTLALTLTPADRTERVWHAAMAKLGRAKTVYVKLEDAISKTTREFWLKKPNLWRVSVDGVPVQICDGKNRYGHKDGNWIATKAPSDVSPDHELFGFESFLKKGGSPGEYLGPGTFEFKGKRFKSVNVKTTEAAAYYGLTSFDPKTFLPIGHKLTEYADTTVHVRYVLVRINPRVPGGTFARPN